MPAGMAKAAATIAVLPPRAATVAMKTPAVTAIAGAQTTINNQIKAVTETVTKVAKMTAMMKQRQWRWQRRRQQQWRKRSGSAGAVASLVAMAAAWQERGIGDGGSTAAS